MLETCASASGKQFISSIEGAEQPSSKTYKVYNILLFVFCQMEIEHIPYYILDMPTLLNT